MYKREGRRQPGRDNRNPGSPLGDLWKWNMGWCPGWNASVEPPDVRFTEIFKRYKRRPRT